MKNYTAQIGLVTGIVLFALSIVGVIFGCGAIAMILNAYPQSTDTATILDKTTIEVTQGFFTSRDGFFIVTDAGNYEIGTLGCAADAYALYSKLQVGHKYKLDISMGLVIGATEIIDDGGVRK